MEIKQLKPIKDHVIVTNMNFKERITNGGIIIPSDDKKSEGIRPRWAYVYAVGPEQTDIKVGEYVLVAHGRWTRGIEITDENGEKLVVRRVDVDDVLLVSDEPQNDETMSNSV